MHPHIMIVDDEPEVLEAALRDLRPIEDTFPLETASSAEEAYRLIQELIDLGERVGVIFCDHIMPGGNGVDLLIRLRDEERTRAVRKVLFTGQAGLEATIEAVNRARLDHYLAKPWDAEGMLRVAREQMTEYLIASGDDLRPYLGQLDPERLGRAIHRDGVLGEG